MKKYILLVLVLPCFLLSTAQDIVKLPFQNAENIEWIGEEKQFFSKIWETEVTTNVSSPTLMIFKADAAKNTGTSVIIAPGGGLYALSIESEGIQVAKWLAKKRNYSFCPQI